MNENLFKVLIVDDEPEARSLLRSLLSEIKNVLVVGEAENSEHALYLLVEHYPNLILMDINMPGKTGMELVQLIKNRNVDVPVVFISAYKEYAIDAIRNGVYDFLLKPVSKIDLQKLIEKHKRLNKKDLPVRLMEVLDAIKEETKIKINSKYSDILLDPAKIIYCSRDDNNTNIFLRNGKKEVANTSLTKIINQISQSDFYMLGRSMLINLNYLRSIDKTEDTCTFQYNGNTWKVQASHKWITSLLKERYNNA